MLRSEIGIFRSCFLLTTMSKLAKEAASFKQTLQRQDYTSWHSQPKPSTSAASTPASGSGLAVAGESSHSPGHKKKRPKTSMHELSLKGAAW